MLLYFAKLLIASTFDLILVIISSLFSLVIIKYFNFFVNLLI